MCARYVVRAGSRELSAFEGCSCLFSGDLEVLRRGDEEGRECKVEGRGMPASRRGITSNNAVGTSSIMFRVQGYSA